VPHVPPLPPPVWCLQVEISQLGSSGLTALPGLLLPACARTCPALGCGVPTTPQPSHTYKRRVGSSWTHGKHVQAGLDAPAWVPAWPHLCPHVSDVPPIRFGPSRGQNRGFSPWGTRISRRHGLALVFEGVAPMSTVSLGAWMGGGRAQLPPNVVGWAWVGVAWCYRSWATCVPSLGQGAVGRTWSSTQVQSCSMAGLGLDVVKRGQTLWACCLSLQTCALGLRGRGHQVWGRGQWG
jgi:hypothetical protein